VGVEEYEPSTRISRVLIRAFFFCSSGMGRNGTDTGTVTAHGATVDNQKEKHMHQIAFVLGYVSITFYAIGLA